MTPPQARQPQLNRMADAVVRMLIVNRREVEFPREAHNLRILRHDDGRVDRFCRNGLQRPKDQRPSPQLGGQLVVSIPPGIARGHDDTT